MKCDHLARMTVGLPTARRVMVSAAKAVLVTVRRVKVRRVKVRRVKVRRVKVVETEHLAMEQVAKAHREKVQDEATDFGGVARDQGEDQWNLQIQNGWLNTPCILMRTATANLINQK